MLKKLTDEIEFRDLVPKTGFLADYMKYSDEVESPGSFHFWVASTIVSSILQRRVYVLRRNKKIFPNLYTVLVAPSGICRKTEAIISGLDLVDGFSWLNVIADKTSPEALLEALMKGTSQVTLDTGTIGVYQDSTGLIRAPELSVFLNKSAYTQDIVSLLTDLYDCRSEFKYITRNKKPIILNNIAVQFLGCTTPDWLANNLPEAAFGGGFMSRFIFVVRQRRDRARGIEKNPAEKYAVMMEKRMELRAQLLRIHMDSLGEIKMNEESVDWYNEWYIGLCENPQVVDSNLIGFVERKPTTLLKLAMILSVSDRRMEINKSDLITGLGLLNWVDERAFDAFKHIDLSHAGRIKLRITELLRLAGGSLSRRNILRRISGQLNSMQDLDAIQQLMEQSGELIVSIENTPGHKSIMYHLPKVKEGERGKD